MTVSRTFPPQKYQTLNVRFQRNRTSEYFAQVFSWEGPATPLSKPTVHQIALDGDFAAEIAANTMPGHASTDIQDAGAVLFMCRAR